MKESLATEIVHDLRTHFLDPNREIRGARIAQCYPGGKLPEGAYAGFTFAVLPGAFSEVGANEASATVLIYVHRPTGAPLAKAFRTLIENHLRSRNLNPESEEFKFQIVKPMQALLEENEPIRQVLGLSCHPLSSGVSISVGTSSRGALGCFAIDDHGKRFGVSAAHVLRREGRAPSASGYNVWQPLEGALNCRQVGRQGPQPYLWHGVHDIAPFELQPGVQIDPTLLAGAATRLRRVALGTKGMKIWKHGPGTGTWSGTIEAVGASTVIYARSKEAPIQDWIVYDAYLVSGSYSRPFAIASDSGAPVFTEDGDLVGFVVGGQRTHSGAIYDTIVVDASSAMENLSLRPFFDSTGNAGPNHG